MAEPDGLYRKRRIYADVSAFSGCGNAKIEQVRKLSRRSFEDFRPGPTDGEDREAVEEMLSIIAAGRTRKASVDL